MKAASFVRRASLDAWSCWAGGTAQPAKMDTAARLPSRRRVSLRFITLPSRSRSLSRAMCARCRKASAVAGKASPSLAWNEKGERVPMPGCSPNKPLTASYLSRLAQPVPGSLTRPHMPPSNDETRSGTPETLGAQERRRRPHPASRHVGRCRRVAPGWARRAASNGSTPDLLSCKAACFGPP